MSAINTSVTAIVTALQATPAIATEVARVRLRPVAKNVATCIVVRPVQAQALDMDVSPGYPIAWDAAIAIDCYARSKTGQDADSVLDPLVSAVYERLMQDPTLAGQVIRLMPQALSYDFDVDGEQTACATFTFIARQRVAGATF